MPEAIARLHMPSGGLAACMSGAIERDTRAVDLPDAARFNFYPASPMVGISWTFAGTFHLVEEGGPGLPMRLGPALPRLLFCGPHRRPSASWSPGPAHALMVGIYPEALTEMHGLWPGDYLDRVLPLEAAAPPEFVDVCEQVFAAAAEATPIQRVEACLARLWMGGQGCQRTPTVGAWLRSLSTRAAHSSCGRGLRQFQRRVKSWTGQSERDLQLYARVEEAFIRRAHCHRADGVNWAALAQDAGFSDQSHLGREIRRVTGHPPARLEALIAQEESFWYYRLVDGWLGSR